MRMLNSLNPDQDQYFVGPNLDQNCFQNSSAVISIVTTLAGTELKLFLKVYILKLFRIFGLVLAKKKLIFFKTFRGGGGGMISV